MSPKNQLPQEFQLGQRWLSDTETNLGLGTVVSIENRRIEILFPATGETRTYAFQSAPLTRVEFAAGDRIKDQNDREYSVIDVSTENGLLCYFCEDLAGDQVHLEEGELNHYLRLNKPQERLLSGRIDKDIWFSLRYQTWLQNEQEARSPVLGLTGPRISLVPHQLFIASEVAGRYAPRVLLADEVGLGKTIEAGMILHHLALAGHADRVLILVPEPLLHQWLVEMLRRFNLRFSLFDQERFSAIESDNPFHDEQRVLCSLEFLSSNPEVARAALGGNWDLLIVDEAHHLHWSEDESSLEYDLVEALSDQTEAVLLLTATPEQLGRAGHFGRLRLLDPHRFHDYQDFVSEEQQYQPIAEAATKLMQETPLDDSEQALINGLLGDCSDQSNEQIIDQLVDRHGTGRVLFRNTRSAIQGFPERRLFPYPLPLPEGYRTLDLDAPACLTPERSMDQGWTKIDPRVDWLTKTLKDLRPEKVLVICAHAETVIALREHLHGREGIHAAIFHEHMDIIERDRAAAYFADPDEGTQVLLCSEIGSEGRNFQFAHHLILFDLPLESDLLEQRIGRLDRIGQTETICIHAPYLETGASEVMFRWYAEGLNAFEATCPAGTAVFEALEQDLISALSSPDQLQPLIDQASALTQRINQDLEQGRDRLLELHSHRPEAAAELVDRIEEVDVNRDINDYMTRFWDAYGVEQEPGPNQSDVLHPGPHMMQDTFPGLPEDGITVTFERDNALAHEDREFLTWEHPMVRGAMDMLMETGLGSSSITLAQHPDIKAGTLLLELIYIAECTAPAELEADRFLPPTAIRLVIDKTGQNLAEIYDHDALQGACLTRKRKLIGGVIKSLGDRVRTMLNQGDALAKTAARSVEEQALSQMHDTLDLELGRLQDLSKRNTGVRTNELEFLASKKELLEYYLSKSHMRLDAARLIVTH